MVPMIDSPSPNHPHPILKAALGTLDMTVESEMELFRQQQTLVTLSDVETSEGTEPGDPQLLPQQATAPSTPNSEVETLSTDLDAYELESNTQDLAEDLTPSELALFRVNAEAEAIEKENLTAGLEQQKAVLESTSANQSSETIVGAPLQHEAERGDSQAANLDPAIEDYLDSSTALRQHLEDSTPEPEVEEPQNTPEKIALLILLGVVGVVAVVLFLNITGLRKKLWPPQQQQLEQPQSSSIETNALQRQPSESSEPPESDAASAIVATKGPDLSSQEFSDVNLGNLSRLESQSKPSPTPNSSKARTVPPPTVPIVKEPTAKPGLFYVVLPYENTSSLSVAQEVVPTAFLTDGSGGKKVQVGALETIDAAQRLAKQLRAKGLSAAIISPS